MRLTISTPPPTLFMSAYFATSLRVTCSPPPPMQIGRRAWTGGGRLRVSREAVARPGAVGSVPSSIPRMIGSASPSQRSRSGNPDPNSIPKSSCSSSNHGAADAEDRPAAADVVEGRRHLGHEGRVAERVGPDHEPDPDALGRLGPGRQGQPALEDRPVRVADDRVEVIPRPEARSSPAGLPGCRPRAAPASPCTGSSTGRRS